MSYKSYMQFCAGVRAPSEALDWLEEQLSARHEFFDTCYRFKRWTPDILKVWIDREELDDPFLLLYAVSEMQKMFDLKEPWYVTWSLIYDRPLIEMYRGGAAVCYKGAITILNIEKFAFDVINKLLDADLTQSREEDSAST